MKSSLPVFVAFPTTPTDNEAAATLLHREVGTWVALGGHAPHLRDALTRLQSLVRVRERALDGRAEDAEGVEEPAALRGYEGLLPSDQVSAAVAEPVDRDIVLPDSRPTTTPIR